MQSASAQISDLAFEKLKAAYPNVDWQSICERVEVDPDLPAEYLNTYLGIDFVKRILRRTEQRLEELSPAEATWYLQQVLGGVEHRTNVPLYVLLQRRLPLAKQMRLEQLLRQEATPCYIWMSDLIEAAGGDPDDVEISEDEAILTQQGLALLTAVWTGEYNLSEEINASAADREAVDPEAVDPEAANLEAADREATDLEEK